MTEELNQKQELENSSSVNVSSVSNVAVSSLRADAPIYKSPRDLGISTMKSSFLNVMETSQPHFLRQQSEQPRISPTKLISRYQSYNHHDAFTNGWSKVDSHSCLLQNEFDENVDEIFDEAYLSGNRVEDNQTFSQIGSGMMQREYPSSIFPNLRHNSNRDHSHYRQPHAPNQRQTPSFSDSAFSIGMMLPSPLSIPQENMEMEMKSFEDESRNLTGYATPTNRHGNYNHLNGNMASNQLLMPSPSPRSKYSSPRMYQPLDVELTDGYVYQVHFKRAHRNFVVATSSLLMVKVGDFVKVEADRGEDMGIVVSKVPTQNFQEFIPTAGYRGRGFGSGQGEKKCILRLCGENERHQLLDKVRDEERSLRVIREKVLERGLPMVILDAEYQFDRHKLVYFFEADRRIDFRDLVSDLFSMYKTRIWMQQVDTSVLPDHDLRMHIARSAGFLPSSYNVAQIQQGDEDDDQSLLLHDHLLLPSSNLFNQAFNDIDDIESTTSDSHLLHLPEQYALSQNQLFRDVGNLLEGETDLDNSLQGSLGPLLKGHWAFTQNN